MAPWSIKKIQKTEEKQLITRDFIYKELCFSLLETFYAKYTKLLFKFDRGNDDEAIFNKDSKIITFIKNQVISRFSLLPNEETISNNIKIISRGASGRVQNLPDNRYFINFNSSAYLISGEGMYSSFNNIFLVYQLYLDTTAIFSLATHAVPFAEAAPQITFLNGSLLIGGTIDDFIVIGAHAVSGKVITAPFQNKANAGEVYKWHCLSVHWNIGVDSSVWCNGKKLTSFTTRRPASSPGNALPFSIGAQRKFRDGSSIFDEPLVVNIFSGAIALCSFNKKEMTEDEIKLHHLIYCKYWYNIDHDPIIFD